VRSPDRDARVLGRPIGGTDFFGQILSLATEDIEFELRGLSFVPWADFLLNPRRLRGSDFLMRWSQGVWSEERIVQAVHETGKYFALPYGPSSTAPEDDIRAFELYFERLERAGLGRVKRPDLLMFRQSDAGAVQRAVAKLGGVEELPFVPEGEGEMRVLTSRAILAVECENSLWEAKLMPDYGARLKPMKRLGGGLGLRKNAVLPMVIVKEEDRIPLLEWEARRGVQIHVWHVFYDMAFGLSLRAVEELIKTGQIEAATQVFQAPGGATTRKTVYKFYYHYAYRLGEAREEPKLVTDYIKDRNGQILPHVRFEGGRLELTNEALEVLNSTSGSPEP